jgi:hypothetical protein
MLSALFVSVRVKLTLDTFEVAIDKAIVIP